MRVYIDLIQKITEVFTKRQKQHLLLLIALILFESFCELLCLPAITPLVNAVSNTDSLSESKLFSIVGRFVQLEGLTEYVVFSVIVIIVVYSIKNIVVLILYRVQFAYVYDGQRELSARLVKQYINKDYFFHKQHNVASIQRDVNEDVSYFYSSVLTLIQLFTEIVVCVVLATYLLIRDFVVTIFTMLLLLGILAIVLFRYKNRLEILGNRTRMVLAERNKWFLQLFGAIKDVKVYSREEYFLSRYCKENKGYTDAVKNQQYLVNIPRPIMEISAISALMIGIVIKLKLSNDITIVLNTMAVFAAAALRLLPSFGRVSSGLTTLSYFSKSVDAVYNHIHNDDSILNDLPIDPDVEYKEGDIIINGLSFCYPDDEEPVLEDVNICIRQNESVALIGPSGAGKTTLADILLGIYSPTKGSILYGDKDVFSNIKAWHSVIGYIPQSIYLLDDSIKANIAFGIEEKDIMDEQLDKAIEKAQLKDFIMTLPEGLSTNVGESGVRLSGGQRQRIGIARALYNDPEVLILDEATSSLDNDTEKAVMDAINGLQGDKTLIIIAHRLTTVKNCDSIYEVKNCRVNKLDNSTRKMMFE